MKELIKEYFFDEKKLPLVMESKDNSVPLAEFVAANKPEILAKMYENGAVLFRNFYTGEVGDFQQAVLELDPVKLDYNFRSTSRKTVNQNVLTSTSYPASEHILMHNENAYKTKWPMKLWFYCDIQPGKGGETPLACSKTMYQRMNPTILKKFEENRLMYVRNYQAGLDLPWQEVFQTEDKADVAKFCEANDIQYEWIGKNHLRTKNVSQTTYIHPVTREKVWFNQSHLFHVSALKPESRSIIVQAFGLDNVPRNVFFENGEPLDEGMLEEIKELFVDVKTAFPWQKGDAVLVDNMLVAHGRHPFEGDRRILVAMSEEYNSKAVPVA